MLCTHMISNVPKFRYFYVFLLSQEKPDIKPMIVSVWCGESKPTILNEYLGPFTKELTDVLQNGIRINEYKITIFCLCFICDSPARAFIKGMESCIYFLM